MNKYAVEGVVGEGAYGVVLKCRNKVCFRVIRGSFAAQRSFVPLSEGKFDKRFDCQYNCIRFVPLSCQVSNEIVAVKKFKECEGKSCVVFRCKARCRFQRVSVEDGAVFRARVIVASWAVFPLLCW
jgi:hypothetical protein